MEKEKVRKDDGGGNKSHFKQITFDETFELYHMNDSTSYSDRGIVESGFKYIIKPRKSELNVKLVKPSFFEIKYTECTKGLMMQNLKMVLDQIICGAHRDQKDMELLKYWGSEKHVILHFDIQNDFPQYFSILFQLMGKEQNVTSSYEEFIRNANKTILICNYRTFRGLENSSVIIVLEPSLYHLKICVLECLSRATHVLDVVVLNMVHTGKRKSLAKTFQNTVNKWKMSNENEWLFSPCKFIDCEKQNETDTNTLEGEILSKDMAEIRKWLAESKSQVSYNETDLRLNIER